MSCPICHFVSRVKHAFGAGAKNPVLDLDLRTRVREKRLWVLGVFFLLVPTLEVGIGILSFNEPGYAMGTTYTLVALFSQTFLLALIAPLSAASRISQEREQRTLPSLLNSRLRPEDIVRGKLLGAWSFVLWLSVLTLPFLVVGWFFGGLSLGAALLIYVLNCLMGMMLAAMALGLSSYFGRTLSAYLATGGVLLAWCVVMPILCLLIGAACDADSETMRGLAYPLLYHCPFMPQVSVVFQAMETYTNGFFNPLALLWGIAVWCGVTYLSIRAAIHGLKRDLQ